MKTHLATHRQAQNVCFEGKKNKENMTKQIEITLSKKKIILVLIGALFFVVFGVLGTLNPESFVSHRYHSPLFIRITSIIGVIFFGICLKNK